MPSANHPIRSTPGESVPKGQAVSAGQSFLLKNLGYHFNSLGTVCVWACVQTCMEKVCACVYTSGGQRDGKKIFLHICNFSQVISERAASYLIKTSRDVVKSSLVRCHDGHEGLLFRRRL